ncbi:MAG: sugar ABC transporter ATP-binding protein [Proteobacteria bacterium]|nr:sugar ABC transporter ATP-binding protein [Pseudomonadota bacterium]
MAEVLLEARSLTKSFPGVRALKGVSLTVGRGEVVAVIGENGAGKSTLMKILAGVQTADTGEIRIDGEPAPLRSVEEALGLGIALIHQELNLAQNLDVAANVFLGREPRRWGLIDTARLHREAGQFLQAVGLEVAPDTRVGSLAIGQQQLVEIAKALSTRARVLIMDEPTSSLSAGEAENLFRVIQDLRGRGVSIVYISHRLGEVSRLADRVVVLRDGENSGELARHEISHAAMVRLMVGRDLSQFYPHQPHARSETVLEVDGLCTPAHPTHPLTFQIRAGEMVGLALVPEDRKREGVVLAMPVRENVSLASLRQDQRHGFRDGAREASLSAEMIQSLRIKTPGDRQVVQFLSGGNQQKVVIGKWLALKPRILLLDEPTRGIDIGAKQEIYRLMEELAAQGVAILFASSEMEEILGMSDRVLVMHEGRIAGELARHQLSEEAIMHLATGTAPTGWRVTIAAPALMEAMSKGAEVRVMLFPEEFAVTMPKSLPEPAKEIAPLDVSVRLPG